MPVRTALAHKWKSDVWYNMWYSMRTMDIRSYFEETWKNVRYGGRTHYHGYQDCIEPGVVLNLEPYLEQITQMEEKLSELTGFTNSQPDCRVEVIFGMEAACNWSLTDNEPGKWSMASGLVPEIFKFAKNVWDAGYLCDLIPSTEVVNGDLFLDGEKLRYGSQTYDAAIVIYPECSNEKYLDKLNLWKKKQINLVVIGQQKWFSDGREADILFNTLIKSHVYYYPTIPSISEISKLLNGFGLEKNNWQQGCVLQDGVFLFTAGASLPSENIFKIDGCFGGRNIKAEVEDFLAIRYSGGGDAIWKGGNIISLSIDGVVQI